MGSWKSYLQRQARLHRMCDDNRAYLSACETKSDAIRLYKQTIDWALEENYPDFDFLKKEFSSCQEDGLFVCHNFNGETLIDQQVYIFHNCTGTIRVGLNVEKQIIPMLYFANNCEMTILGIDGQRIFPDRVPLYVFGKNVIHASNDLTIEFRMYKFEEEIGNGK